MQYTPPTNNRPGNRLLKALPDAEYARLADMLEHIKLPVKLSLYEPNEPIEYVYFVLSGVASVVAKSEGSPGVEVATIGNEGMVGVPVFLGSASTPMHTFMQVPGEGLRMSTRDFRELLPHSPVLHNILSRYVQGLFTQISQSAACNRMHSIEERCARWLLMTHDRVTSDEFPLTQEFLGQMLGVRRATVNLAAGVLQKAGYIRYVRGRITVVDRVGLEGAACECYKIIRDEYERLLKEPTEWAR